MIANGIANKMIIKRERKMQPQKSMCFLSSRVILEIETETPRKRDRQRVKEWNSMHAKYSEQTKTHEGTFERTRA